MSITAAAAADKILELEQVHRSRYHPHYIQPKLTFKVLTSISSVREKLQDAVSKIKA